MTRLPETHVDTQGPDSVSIALELAPDLPVFAGHFPHYAILPGVAQIDWAMELASRHLGIARRAASDFQVKFRRVIVPPARPVLELRVDRRRQRLHFQYVNQGAVCSQGSIMLSRP